MIKKTFKLIFGKQIEGGIMPRIVASYGSMTLAVISLILTVLNIINQNWFMTATTALLVVGFIVAMIFGFVHKIFIARLLIAIMCTIIFSVYAVTGENEGFAILWTLLVPILSMQLIGLRIGFCVSTYFQIFLIVLFYTPLVNNVRAYYTETFMVRFPILYLASFILCTLLMCQYQTLFNRTHKRAFEDSLTGLNNRNFYNIISKKIEADPELAIVSIDINGLKYTNDNFGHEAGDKLIRGAAKNIIAAFPEDYKFRMGGDEFLIISKKSGLESKLDSLNKCGTSLSIGVALQADNPEANLHELMRIADTAMYEDKARYYKEKEGAC